MSLGKCKTLMKAFIESQFIYCPLIWMLYSRALNDKLIHIYERALSIIFSYYKSSFNQLLDRDSPFAIHPKILQSLATEIYKYPHGQHLQQY